MVKFIGEILVEDSIDAKKGVKIGNTTEEQAGIIRYNEGDFEGYKESAWVSLTSEGGGGGASTLDDLTDVTIVSPQDGSLLQYDNTSSEWINSEYALPTADGTVGQILTTDGLGALSFTDNSVDNLSNTTIDTPTNGQILKYDNISERWINADANALPTNSSYFGATLSTTQTAGLGDGNPVRLDTFLQNSSDVSIDPSTYTITLPAGVWILQAAISCSYSSASGIGRYQWYNVTDSTYVGNQTFDKPTTSTSNSGVHLTPYAVVSLPSQKDFQLRIVNPTGLTNIFGASGGTDYRSQAIGYTTVSHLTTAPEYAFISLNTNQTTGLTANSRIAFDTISSTSGISNSSGVISLAGGYTYELSAQIVPSFSSASGDLRIQWYNITDSVFVGGLSLIFPVTRSNNNPLNTECRAILTTTQNITVEARIVSNTAAININGLNFTYATVKTIEGGNAPKVYSTSEQATMDRWLDGKTVYRKSFEINGNLSSGVNTAHGITGLETLVNYRCNILDTSTSTWYFANTWGASGDIRSRVSDTNVYIQTNSGFTANAKVILEYTKS